MPPEPPNRADVIFYEALGLPAEEREAYVLESCGDDALLLAEVQALINAHEEAPTDFLGSPVEEEVDAFDATIDADGSGKDSGKAAGPITSAFPRMVVTGLSSSLSEKEGDRVGSYKLLQQIGEGGFGTVWMAEQSEPISRKVALKVIKAGMDTKEVLARFEAERQAVTLMDHTHIAKVLDAGATESGRPWFAMELVKGVPITQFCDEQKLNARERLELFGDVCAAIHHAHQKGVIHRDIKPSNVMVTLHGDKPVVKVIDFGIAKATQSKLTDKTLFTAFEQMIGTPVYMSPEQASLSGLDIDTRSDIYALGVLLYELLTGKPPFDGKSLVSAGYEEMRRIIREEEPPRPSLRLSDLSGEEEPTRITGTHGVEPQKLSRLVRGELDWIVMKAIEKDRSRRYETANAFAADIGRYLNDEPVQAVAPSAAYQFRKFARRNKAVIGTTALITLVLVGATGVSLWQASEANAARIQSDRDKADAEAISSFLIEVFQSPDPARDGRTITVAETLDAAVKNLETALVDQPERRAQLQLTLANTYGALGLFREAIPLGEKRRDYYLANAGPEHPDTVSAMNNLSNYYQDAGRWEEAIGLREEVLELLRNVNGPEDPLTQLSILNLTGSYNDVGRYDEAIVLGEEVLGGMRKEYGPEHPDTLLVMLNLAVSYRDAGRREEAIKLREEGLELMRKVNGPEHPATLMAMNNLLVSYNDAGRYEEALKLGEEALELTRKVNGPEHPDTLLVMLNLVTTYSYEDHRDDSLELGEDLLELMRKVNGPEHPKTVMAMLNLVDSYQKSGRWEDAVEMGEEGLELMRKVNGPVHPNTLMAMLSLANARNVTGRQDEGLVLSEEVLELMRKVNGPEHPDTLKAMRILVNAYNATGRQDEGLVLSEEVLELMRKVNGPEHPDTLVAMRSLANDYNAAGREDEGLKLSEDLLELTRTARGPEHPDTLNAMRNLVNAYQVAGRQVEELALTKMLVSLDPEDATGHTNLGASLCQQGKYDEAIESFRRAIELDPGLSVIHNNLGMALQRRRKNEEAIESFRQAITLDPEFSMAHNNLGFALFRQGKTKEAIEAYRHAIEIDPKNVKAMANLAQAHETLGHVDRSGISIVRFLLVSGMEDDAALVKQIPIAFRQLEVEFPSVITPSEEAVAGYYDAYKNQFSDTAVHLRIISGHKPDKTREFMETVRKELKEGGNFAAAARNFSDDSFASDGGDRGWVSRGRLRADLDKAAFALKAGEISDVIEDDTHFHIFNVVERRDGSPPPLEEVREKVIEILKGEAQSTLIKGWIEQAKKEMAAHKNAREEGETEGQGDER